MYRIYVTTSERAERLYKELKNALVKLPSGEVVDALDAVEVIYNPQARFKKEIRK